jgi:hypothetical protein
MPFSKVDTNLLRRYLNLDPRLSEREILEIEDRLAQDEDWAAELDRLMNEPVTDLCASLDAEFVPAWNPSESEMALASPEPAAASSPSPLPCSSCPGVCPGANRRRSRVRASLLALAFCAFAVSVRLTVFTGTATAEPSPWFPLCGDTTAELTAQFPEFTALRYRWRTGPPALGECFERIQAVPLLAFCKFAEKLPGLGDPLVDEWVEEIPDPSYDGFEIAEESKLFDLTFWKPISPEEIHSGRVSPAYQTRVLTLRRIPGHPDNRTIRFKYWTQGYCVDPVKTGPRDVIREGRRQDPRARRECRVWELEADVSDHEEGEWFQLVTRAVFWNGFPDQEEQWAATAVASSSLRRCDFGILLPACRPVKEWSLWRYPTGPHEREPVDCLKSGNPPGQARGILYWPIAQLQPGYVYEIGWSW